MRDRGFTARALGIGAVVGVLGAVSNVYVSLKTGWSLPVMTTAAVVGLSVGRLQRRALSRHEVLVSSALASAAAFITGGGNLAAVPALVLLGGTPPGALSLVFWFATTAILGVLIAPLLGDRIRTLPFPTATATATLVREREGSAGRMLWIATAAAGAFAIVRRLARIPPTLAGSYTFGVDTSLLLVAVGGLMTWTTAWSTLLGGAITYGLLAPRLVHAGMAEPTYRSLVGVMVWPAAAVLVTAALTELLLDGWRFFRATRREGSPARGRWWLPIAPAVLAIATERVVFDLPWLVAGASLPLAFAFAYVAARSMGETDVVPTKALAPLAQGAFGALADGIVGPVMGPNLTGAVAMQAADTLGSLKVAALLEVPARSAIVARVCGALVGAVVVVVAYRLVVPDAHVLPTLELPAPGVLVWKSVAEVVAARHLPETMRAPIGIGAGVGIVLALIGRVMPARARRFVPSAMGIGSGMVLPASAAVTILLGALLRMRAERRYGLESALAIASGALAGESLVGIALQLFAI